MFQLFALYRRLMRLCHFWGPAKRSTALNWWQAKSVHLAAMIIKYQQSSLCKLYKCNFMHSTLVIASAEDEKIKMSRIEKNDFKGKLLLGQRGNMQISSAFPPSSPALDFAFAIIGIIEIGWTRRLMMKRIKRMHIKHRNLHPRTSQHIERVRRQQQKKPFQSFRKNFAWKWPKFIGCSYMHGLQFYDFVALE